MKYLLLAILVFLFSSPVYAADTTARELTSRPDLPLKVKDNGDGTYSMGIGATISAGLPVPATTTVASGSISVANAYQSALSSNPLRKGCLLTNKSTATILVFVGPVGSATAANSIILAAGTGTADGGSFSCSLVNGVVITDAISVTSATVSSGFNVMSQ